MNKKTIITILLALVAMAGQAKVSIPESIADTYWRNETTGDWEIGFTESCAIYECQLWKYNNINEKDGKVVLTLNNGKQDARRDHWETKRRQMQDDHWQAEKTDI